MNFTTPMNNSSNIEVSVIKYQGTLANVTEDENAGYSFNEEPFERFERHGFGY